MLTSLTGLVVTERGGAVTLLGLMLASALLALMAALAVRWIDGREGEAPYGSRAAASAQGEPR